MIKYTKEFERHWRRAAPPPGTYQGLQPRMKRTAYNAWRAARRPRVMVRKRSGF